MDFELIINSLYAFPDIEYRLYGPLTHGIKVPDHERITYGGTIQHHRILEVGKSSDLFVMPFKMNDLIRSVDPVKVYEYIGMGIPALIVRYEETIKFEKYVYLYTGQQEYLDIIGKMRQSTLPAKSSRADAQYFINENTWEKRAEDINVYLMGMTGV